MKPALLSLIVSSPAALCGEPPQGENGVVSPLRFDRVSPEVKVVRLVEPAVASIQTNQLVEQGYFDLFGNWYRTHRGSRPYSQGSGIVVDPDGLLITNEHVVRGADQIKVSFNSKYDKNEYEATLVSADVEDDLALLKISRSAPFPAVPLGHSDDLMIGERVIAIGNPYGEQNTVTAGILSAMGRDVVVESREEGRLVRREFKGLIQTDASINPGNSGGPLLNVNGELIGINNAIHPLAEGIGFAIPVDRVVEILHRKLLDPEASKAFWLGARFEKGAEPRIAEVEERSPAASAGLRPGDVLLSVDGQPIPSLYAARKALGLRKAGDRIRLRVSRGGKESEIALVLGPYFERVTLQRLGLAFDSSAENGSAPLQVREVVPDGPAARIGVQRGDLFLAFTVKGQNVFGRTREQRIPVDGADTLVTLLDRVEPGSSLGIVISRRGEEYKGELTVR